MKKQLSKHADRLVELISSGTAMVEMRANRGQLFDHTMSYQIRMKPFDPKRSLDECKRMALALLTSKVAQGLGVKYVEHLDRSPHSGKYQSITFHAFDGQYDLVLALGANKGEAFEKKLVASMIDVVHSNGNDQLGKMALAELERAGISGGHQITCVAARTGTTRRSEASTPAEAGAILADVYFGMSDNTTRNVSIKNSNGKTIAQIGVSKAFNADLTANTKSDQWKKWIAPFELDLERLEKGLVAAEAGTPVPWRDQDHLNKLLPPDSPIHGMMRMMFGSDYFYLMEVRVKAGLDFKAIHVNDEYLDRVLKGLRIDTVSYPNAGRKMVGITMSSDSCSFKLDLRNAKGKGSARPLQLQLKASDLPQ